MGNKIEGVTKLQYIVSDEEKQDVINQRMFVMRNSMAYCYFS